MDNFIYTIIQIVGIIIFSYLAFDTIMSMRFWKGYGYHTKANGFFENLIAIIMNLMFLIPILGMIYLLICMLFGIEYKKF